jgi:hypothetical protein
MGGGAWPFLVGGAICLVNSVNERDLGLLNSYADPAIQNPAAGEFGSALGRVGGCRGNPVPRDLPQRSEPLPVGRSGRRPRFLEGLPAFQPTEARGNNRSVMPLDVLGRTRATLIETASPSASAEGSGQPRQPRSCWG